jgi:hypothetical protein
LYTSKWFPDGKGRTRFQFLKPKMWVEAPDPGYYVELCSPGSIRHGDHGSAIDEWAGWVVVVPNLRDNGEPTYAKVLEPAGRPWVAVRRDGTSDFVIRYHYPRRRAFDATYRQICESFRVIREK